jgi:DNA-binding NarL/FixJ family response regulator
LFEQGIYDLGNGIRGVRRGVGERGQTGMEVEQSLRLLSQIAVPPPVVVVSDNEDTNQILEALDRGARGFIPTSVPLAVAVEAIRLVKAGGTFVPASSLMATRHAVEQPGSKAEARGKGLFTEKQIAVVEALRQGKPNKIIAYELKLRESTVKVHIRNIMKKMKATNRTEVVYKINDLLFSGNASESAMNRPAAALL